MAQTHSVFYRPLPKPWIKKDKYFLGEENVIDVICKFTGLTLKICALDEDVASLL